MKKLFLGIVAFVAFGVPAGAADLPARVYTKAPPPSVHSWTGWYVGIDVGGAWSTADETTTPNAALLDPAQLPLTGPFVASRMTRSLHPSGFTGGAHVGYNYQINNWVAGFEADVEYFGLRGGGFAFGPTVVPVSGNTVTGSMAVTTDYLATFRGRLGLPVIDRGLLYVTGGLAVSTINFNSNVTVSNPVIGLGFLNGSTSKTNAGWVVGAGFEYAFAPRWSARIEYLHVDLGSQNSVAPFTGPLAVAPPPCVGCTLTTNTSLRADVVRAGVSLKLN